MMTIPERRGGWQRHLKVGPEKGIGNMGADKTSPTGNQNFYQNWKTQKKPRPGR